MQEKQITFDIANEKFKVTSHTDYSLIANIDYATDVRGGIKVELDTGSGFVTIYDNSALSVDNYTVDIDAVNDNVTTQDVQVALPLSNGLVTVGTYKVTTTELITLDTPAVISVDTVTTFDYTTQVDVNICLSHTINCVAPLVSVVDKGIYTFNGTEPTTNTGSLTLTYPASANQTPLVDITIPLSLTTDNVWTGSSTALATRALTYDFEFYSEYLELAAEDYLDVVCDTLCSVYACVKSTREAIKANKGVNTTKYNSLLTSYNEAMSVAEQIDMAVNCGDLSSIDGLVAEIKSILNCDCASTIVDCSSSTISQQVLGIGNIISGGSGTSLTVTDGVTSISDVSSLTIGDGLTLTNPATGEANVVADVTQAELDITNTNIATNVTNIGTNTTSIATIATILNNRLKTVTVKIDLANLDTAADVITSDLIGKPSILYGAVLSNPNTVSSVVADKLDLFLHRKNVAALVGTEDFIIGKSDITASTFVNGTFITFEQNGNAKSPLSIVDEEIYVSSANNSVILMTGVCNITLIYALV